MKKLIIVCEEKMQKYGDFLAQLISRKDDEGEEVVGVKDGSTAAQVWTEKDYVSNSSQISSEQYILFIGDSKMIRDKRFHMQKIYSEYGMNYGWLGKQAVLFVDHSVSLAEYDEFFKLVTEQFSAGSQPEAKKLLSSKENEDNDKESLVSNGDVEMQTIEVRESEEKCNVEKPKLRDAIKNAKTVIKKTADLGKNAFNEVSESVSVMAKSKDIEDQQYTCLVLLFYLRDLATFLGINEA